MSLTAISLIIQKSSKQNHLGSKGYNTETCSKYWVIYCWFTCLSVQTSCLVILWFLCSLTQDQLGNWTEDKDVSTLSKCQFHDNIFRKFLRNLLPAFFRSITLHTRIKLSKQSSLWITIAYKTVLMQWNDNQVITINS